MSLPLESLQIYGKDSMDAAMKSVGALSRSVQAIAAETADYSSKSFKQGAETWEKILGARSVDKVLELQSEYAKSAYESFVAESTRLNELYADLVKEIYKPFEAALGKLPIPPSAQPVG